MTNITTDKEIEIKELECSYFVSSSHRSPKKSTKKSFWTITKKAELKVFKTAKINTWGDGNVLWGIHLNDEKSIIELGENPYSEKLKIAKFVDKKNTKIWHGYPADYVRNLNDRPETATLKKWKEQDYIEKHHIVKIRMGKICNL